MKKKTEELSLPTVIFSDLHIHNYKQFDNAGSRLENCLSVLEDVYTYCDRLGIKLILFVGDLYDQQKVLPIEVINATVRKMLELKNNYPDIQVVAITGNHDQSRKSLIDNESPSALDHIHSIYSDFKVVDNGECSVGEYGVIIHGIPYYEYPEHFRIALERRAEKANMWGMAVWNILLIHQTPSGIINKDVPMDIDPNDPLFDPFDFVFCGHIHERQELTHKFLVVGSPIHRNLSDAGQNKGFIVMDLMKPEKGYEFVSLKGQYPEYVERTEGDQLQDGDEKNYVVWKPDLSMIAEREDEGFATNEFKSDLTPAELITNFWKEVDGNNKALLETGLSFIS